MQKIRKPLSLSMVIIFISILFPLFEMQVVSADPPPPAWVTLTVTGPTTATVNWSGGTGATYYYVGYSTDPDNFGWNGGYFNSSTTSKNLTGLTPNTTYYAFVASVTSGWAYTGWTRSNPATLGSLATPSPTPVPTATPTPTPVPFHDITVSIDDSKGMVINTATGLAVKNGNTATVINGNSAQFKVVSYGGYKIDEVAYGGGVPSGGGMFKYTVNTGAVTENANLVVTFTEITAGILDVDTYNQVFVSTEDSEPISVSYGTVHGWKGAGSSGMILWNTADADVTLEQALADSNDDIHVFSVTSGPLAKGINGLGQFGAKVKGLSAGDYKLKAFVVNGGNVRYGEIVTFQID